MPGVVRITDLCSGHGPCSPRPNMTSSMDTFVNNLGVERFGDVRTVHCLHTGTNVGIHDVYVNNRMIQTCGDPVSCGSTQTQCTTDVFVNNI